MLLGGRFELGRRVGAGGMGVVHEALDRERGTRVAVKILELRDANAAARFAREALLTAELAHPAIVSHVAHGVAEDGRSWLAMEWLEGEDLRARLAGGPLPQGGAVALAARLADALAAAHARGVVHRDLKPSNVFLPSGRLEAAKLIDFGVARVIGDPSALTGVATAIGTPAYMSPEQARGERNVDGRSDLYALGVLLFECLTGRTPHLGASPVAVMAKILLAAPPRLRALRPELPGSLDELIARLLERERALRPDDATAVGAELRGIAAGAAGAAPPSPALTGAEGQLVCVVLLTGLPDAAALAGLAREHGARLEAIAGGAFVAVFHGGGAATDLAARAATWALAARRLAPAARLALATGQAVLGGALPLGEVIETVAALAAAPDPTGDGLRIDDAAAGLLDGRFELLRDTHGPIVARPAPDDTGRRLLGRRTPFVGRDRELAVLDALAAACAGETTAQAVLVTGPAGIGKSRLVAELLGRVRRAGAVKVWQGRGDPLRQGAPFGLLAPAVRHAAGIADGTAPAEARARLLETVGRCVPPAEHGRVADFLGELCGVPAAEESPQLRAARRSPVLLSDQMRRAWEDFVLAEAQPGPVVLVLEDLHWGDLPTVKFVDAALRVARSTPFMVVAAARPQVTELFPGLWTERALTHLQLGELSRGAAERLVRAVLGEAVTGEAAARLAAQAGGNPFYLEELVRAAGEGRDAGVPETVLAMAVARLEQLDAEARRLLRAASVFGDAFWSGGVARLLGAHDGSRDELAARVGRLVDRDWLVAVPGSAYAGEEEHRFRHSILREAAYATLTERDRLTGHRLAGAWLEERGEGDALVLATHLECGADLPGAARAWRRAAEQALAADDLEAALERAGRAARCGAEEEALGELRLLEAVAHHWRTEHDEAHRSAADALRLLPPLGVAWYRAVEQLVEASLPTGDVDSLVALAASLETPPGLAGDADAGAAYVTAGATLAMALALAGRHAESDAVMARVEALLAEAPGAPAPARARADFARATRAMVAGDQVRGIDHAIAAIAAFDEAGDRRSAALLRTNVAYALTELGAYDEAEPVLREVAAVAERMGLTFVLGTIQNNLGLVLARRGRLDEAVAAERASVAMHRSDHRFAGLSRVYLAAIHRLAGDLEGAEAEAREAVAVLAQVAPMRAFALATLADVLGAAARPAEALAAAGEAMALLEQLGAIDEGEAAVRLAWAEALLGAGEEARARAAAAAARDRVLERAARISDPARRESFLRRVPENARTVVLAERLAKVS